MKLATDKGHSKEPVTSTSPERREETGFKQELEILRYYDTVILVDDSSSMVGGRWREARNALATLSEIAMAYDQDGIDIYFLNELTTEGQNITCPEAVESLFEKVRPWGWTPIARRLRELTGEYMQGLRESSLAGVMTKPINYIVITDGVPTDHDELPNVIMNLAMALENGRYTNNQLGIQFVQVGDDRWATQYLQNLDGDVKYYNFPRDIVDASPYSTGDTLTGEKILKILKGAIDRRLDNSGSVGRPGIAGSRTIQSY
ncbi:hypothetical protein NLI96_g8230 [Meripilus lineatus]|uniref:VWFA domain-containing protein n=1 Tax=Meripilus lineatus TaxID=2056292 RepID=A0AAD5UZ98_9APHY|nr:hypothetical protein NLI96_g8230 [Physisporinus lineatus]